MAHLAHARALKRNQFAGAKPFEQIPSGVGTFSRPPSTSSHKGKKGTAERKHVSLLEPTSSTPTGDLPADMQCLLSILEGMESVTTLKRGGRCRHVMFRGDKEGVESAAKRSFKVRQGSFSC